jgi:hypothetical protein
MKGRAPPPLPEGGGLFVLRSARVICMKDIFPFNEIWAQDKYILWSALCLVEKFYLFTGRPTVFEL